MVYDLGANNGLHSLLFANLVGSNGRVFSFEPLKSNCDEIKENLSLNNIGNVEIVNAAVGDSNGETTFYLGQHDKQGSVVGIGLQTGKEEKVKIITLDSFIDREINLLVNGEVKYKARPGLKKHRLAVRVTNPVLLETEEQIEEQLQLHNDSGGGS